MDSVTEWLDDGDDEIEDLSISLEDCSARH